MVEAYTGLDGSGSGSGADSVACTGGADCVMVEVSAVVVY